MAGHELGLSAFPRRPKIVRKVYDWTDDNDFAAFAQSIEDTAGDCFDTGTGVVAATAGPAVKMLSTNANDDTAVHGLVTPFYIGDLGAQMRFVAEIQLSDADGSAFTIGVYNANDISSASPLDGTAYIEDGVFFIKEIGDANLDFATEKNGADATYTNRDNAVGTILDATWHVLAFEVQHSSVTSGTFLLKAFLDGVPLSIPNCDILSAGMPNDVNLRLSIAHRGGAGDYMLIRTFGSQYMFPGEYTG